MNNIKYTRVVTADQMREMDMRSTADFGISGIILMENAGRAVFDTAVDMMGGDVQGKCVLVACGPGNNGGDGFVVARYLHQAAARPVVVYYGDRDKAAGDALMNIEIASALKIPIKDNPDPATQWPAAESCHLVIDALLGTGAKGSPREPFGDAIAHINQYRRCGVPILSVDIPSGVEADTGSVPLHAVVSDRTVTFALPKIGLLTYPGASHTGSLIVADIGIPAGLADDVAGDAVYINDWRTAESVCSNRQTDAHKGSCGHVGIVAGSVGMTGAAVLTATGALRIGSGLVTVLVPQSLNDILEIKLTEAMTVPVPEGKARAFGVNSLGDVLSYVNKWDAAVIGPGLGRDSDTVEFVRQLIRQLKKPAIIDADALFAIAQELSVLKECKAPLIITPHPGEMAMLTGTTVEKVESNRLDTARSLAKKHKVTVVLKGANSLIAKPDGQAFINTTGSPGMATGGTGDVLSGMIGGLLAQKCDAVTAAGAAVYYHGLAGEIAADKFTEPAMLATDLADSIGDAIMQLRIKSAEQI